MSNMELKDVPLRALNKNIKHLRDLIDKIEELDKAINIDRKDIIKEIRDAIDAQEEEIIRRFTPTAS